MNTAIMLSGDRCRMRGNDAIFTVTGFDGRMYRLESEHGVELRAGCRAVQRVMVPADKKKAAEAQS